MLRRLPAGASFFFAYPALRAYPFVRYSHSLAMQRRWASCLPGPIAAKTLSLRRYYATRFHMALGSLKIHGRPLQISGDSNIGVQIIGRKHYDDTLRLGRPLVLLGWHQGVVELLHRLPHAPPGRPFRILTARAFAPALTRFMKNGRELDGKRTLFGATFRKATASSNPKATLDADQMSSGISGIRSVIREAGILAVMVDQHPAGFGEAASLELFGRLAVPYPGALLSFLIRKGCLFLPVSTRLLPQGGSEFRYHEAIDLEGIEQSRETALRERLRGLMETAILAAPDQWNWSYGNIRITR